MHHADPMEEYQPNLESWHDAWMQHWGDTPHSTFKHYVGFKGLRVTRLWTWSVAGAGAGHVHTELLTMVTGEQLIDESGGAQGED